MKIPAMIVCALMLAAADRLSIQARKAYDPARYDEAIADWSEARKLAPDDPAIYFNRAAAYAGKGDVDKALADYSEAIRLSPKDEEAIRLRARLYLKKRENAKALEDFSSLIRLNPCVRNYLCRADVYVFMGENGKAAADYTEMIRLDPEDKSSYGSRVSLYVKMGEWDKAIGDYGQMIRLDPADDSAYYGRSEAWFKKKDFDHAIADVTEAIRLETAEPMGLGSRQDVSLTRGAGTARHSIVPVVDSLVMRGTAYSRNGMYDKAEEDFNLAISDAETSPVGFNAAALFYATCPKAEFRDGARAVELAMKACVLSEWKNDGTIDTLAAAEAEAGKWEEAVSYEKMAVEMAAKKRDGKLGGEYGARAALYEAHKPWREEKTR